MIALLQTAERTSNLSQINNYVYQRHVFAYEEAIKYLGNMVVELGCGSGYGTKILAPYCDWFVGIDKHIPSKAFLNSNSAFFKCRFPDLSNIGDNSFDTVVCFQVIEHIKDDSVMLNEIYRILKPGGKMLLTTPNKLMSLTRNPYHIREYTPHTMQQLVAACFNKYKVTGVYGDSIVMEYYAANKRSVDNITCWDIFNLQNTLPARLLKIPYNIANNINRLILYQQNAEVCSNINWDNHYLGSIGPECLDFFVIAEKESK